MVTRIDSLSSESTFSRSFSEFAENGLGDIVQNADGEGVRGGSN